MIKNRKSAELSVPSLLRRESDGSSESVYSWINDWTAGEPYWEGKKCVDALVKFLFLSFCLRVVHRSL